jgi:hypothetical protein
VRRWIAPVEGTCQRFVELAAGMGLPMVDQLLVLPCRRPVVPFRQPVRPGLRHLRPFWQPLERVLPFPEQSVVDAATVDSPAQHLWLGQGVGWQLDTEMAQMRQRFFASGSLAPGGASIVPGRRQDFCSWWQYKQNLVIKNFKMRSAGRDNSDVLP